MSKDTVQTRYDSITAYIDALPSDVTKLRIIEDAGTDITTVATYLNRKEYFQTDSDIDIECNERLDYVEDVIAYYEDGKDISGGGTSKTVTDDPFTPTMEYKDNLILFEGETVVIPNDTTLDLPIDYEITFKQMTTAQTLFSPEAGVDTNSILDLLSISEQYGVVTIKKIGPNLWSLFGALG